MATRLDRVTTTSNRTGDDLDLAPSALIPHRSHLPDLVGTHVPIHQPRRLPTRALGGAMVSWLTLTFGVCYVALPALLAIVGWNTGLIAGISFSLPAFALASFVAIVAVLIAQPRMQLSAAQPRDPVVAATLGGLGVWAVVHNTSSLLMPFLSMSALELMSFVSLNVLEMTLLGMMFASFTKRTSVALALGGGFQMLVLGLVMTLMSLV